MSLPMQTLAAPVAVEGVGLHTGAPVQVLLQPCREPGLRFVRTDLPEQPVIAAAPRSIVQTTHATTLQENGATLSTTEHLLAALSALGVTHCRIAVDGPEIPILDGSAAPWCEAIAGAGLQPLPELPPRAEYSLREPVWIAEGGSSVIGLPHPEFRLSVAVDFDVAYAGRQIVDCIVTAESFVAELAAARTFARADWIEPLRAQGLIKGGSADNAILLKEDGPSSPWRMENELARHKALDVVGDLALLTAADGGVLQAHIIAVKAGHLLHRRWMEECLRRDALRCSRV